MTQSDLSLLLDMGFDPSRAELAVKRTGGRKTRSPPADVLTWQGCLTPGANAGSAVQGALQWLEDNQEKSLEELQSASAAAKASDDDDEATAAAIAALEDGQTAKSLVCGDCGKKFRSPEQAQYHATKS